MSHYFVELSQDGQIVQICHASGRPLHSTSLVVELTQQEYNLLIAANGDPSRLPAILEKLTKETTC